MTELAGKRFEYEILTVHPVRADMKRWAGGGIILSSFASRYQLGLFFQAGSLLPTVMHPQVQSAQSRGYSSFVMTIASWSSRACPGHGMNENRLRETPMIWCRSHGQELKDDADHERGLFKILALYVDDKLKHRDGKSFREYLETDESPRFEAGLDLATLVFDAAVTVPVATLLGVPTVAVGLALVGIQYGFRRATDTVQERVGDQSI